MVSKVEHLVILIKPDGSNIERNWSMSYSKKG